MTLSFTAEEIFEIAIQIERDGKTFYQRAAELFDGGIKRTLLGLAQMEATHETFFTQLKELLFKPVAELTDFNPDGEAERYLAALAGNNIFNLNQSAEESWPSDSSIDDILDLAIQREKESVVYYVGLKEIVRDELGKSRIEDIIKEETKHVTLLTKMRLALRKEE